MRKHILPLVLAALLAACAQPIVKVGAGEAVVGDRLAVKADSEWNQIPPRPMLGPQTTWTVDGMALDALRFYVGLADGAQLTPPVKDKRPIAFKAGMAAHELADLVQATFALDGSTVTLDKVDRGEFLGAGATRVEFTVLRKIDEVKLRGSAWLQVRDGKLYAVVFSAPRLGFYDRHIAKVNALVASARLK
jgi:hypothetical protein